jgi:hypothetical protein
VLASGSFTNGPAVRRVLAAGEHTTSGTRVLSRLKSNPGQASGDPRHLLAACDLIETPSRMARFRMRSGDRSIAFAICSCVFLDLANSSKRRSSLKDQDFRTIAKSFLSRPKQ